MTDLLSRTKLDEFLGHFSTEARSLAVATREVILQVFPDAIEAAEGKEIGYGFDRGYKGLVYAISMKKSGINLAIAGGATLKDPNHLLCGTGKVHRHVEILEAATLKNPALTELLRNALNTRRQAFQVQVHDFP